MSYKSRLEDAKINLELILKHRESYGKGIIERYAIERAFMIVGEAMRVLNNKYKVDWNEYSNMIRMSDLIDHQYTEIDYGIVIDTITYELPSLLKLINKMIKELK